MIWPIHMKRKWIHNLFAIRNDKWVVNWAFLTWIWEGRVKERLWRDWMTKSAQPMSLKDLRLKKLVSSDGNGNGFVWEWVTLVSPHPLGWGPKRRRVGVAVAELSSCSACLRLLIFSFDLRIRALSLFLLEFSFSKRDCGLESVVLLSEVEFEMKKRECVGLVLNPTPILRLTPIPKSRVLPQTASIDFFFSCYCVECFLQFSNKIREGCITCPSRTLTIFSFIFFNPIWNIVLFIYLTYISLCFFFLLCFYTNLSHKIQSSYPSDHQISILKMRCHFLLCP